MVTNKCITRWIFSVRNGQEFHTSDLYWCIVSHSNCETLYSENGEHCINQRPRSVLSLNKSGKLFLEDFSPLHKESIIQFLQPYPTAERTSFAGGVGHWHEKISSPSPEGESPQLLAQKTGLPMSQGNVSPDDWSKELETYCKQRLFQQWQSTCLDDLLQREREVKLSYFYFHYRTKLLVFHACFHLSI